MTNSSGTSEALTRETNRARSWDRAAALGGRTMSVWRLERFKAAMVQAEDGALVLPLIETGRFSTSAWWRAAFAMMIAVVMWLGYLLLHRGAAGQARLPGGSGRLVALHGEVSTRTRHLLRAVEDANPPIVAAILLGRLQHTPAQVAALWAEEAPGGRVTKLPLLVPMSPRACIASLADLPKLIAEGLTVSASDTTRLGLRDEVATAFRIFMGAVAARWWAHEGAPCEVIFGITGTGDTTLLERAIQDKGGRSVHAVHGQATGPNFVGISDEAWFRTLHDAQAYSRLGCYGRCSIQPANPIPPQRGETGILLLTNLAHPMNADFRRFGLRDEEKVLKLVGEVARGLGETAQPLFWRPHPVIETLPAETRAAIRATALSQGFTELHAGVAVADHAATSRWVLTSPSTVALDLLETGILSVVVDPQSTRLDTAIAHLPFAGLSKSAVLSLMRRLDDYRCYVEESMMSWKLVGPARPLSLATSFERTQ